MVMNRTRRWTRRGIKSALGIVTATAALGIVVAAAPAQAAPQACSGQVNVNVCLAIEPYGNAGHDGLFRVHIGIDFRITQQDAQPSSTPSATHTSPRCSGMTELRKLSSSPYRKRPSPRPPQAAFPPRSIPSSSPHS